MKSPPRQLESSKGHILGNECGHLFMFARGCQEHSRRSDHTCLQHLRAATCFQTPFSHLMPPCGLAQAHTVSGEELGSESRPLWLQSPCCSQHALGRQEPAWPDLPRQPLCGPRDEICPWESEGGGHTAPPSRGSHPFPPEEPQGHRLRNTQGPPSGQRETQGLGT